MQERNSLSIKVKFYRFNLYLFKSMFILEDYLNITFRFPYIIFTYLIKMISIMNSKKFWVISCMHLFRKFQLWNKDSISLFLSIVSLCSIFSGCLYGVSRLYMLLIASVIEGRSFSVYFWATLLLLSSSWTTFKMFELFLMLSAQFFLALIIS